MTERRGFFGRLFGSGKPAAKHAAASLPAPRAATSAAAPTVWPSLGVVFEIDSLGATDEERMFYGTPARLIFMKHFDPRAVGRSYLWQGDTQQTLSGDARQFCVAVSARHPSALTALRGVFSKASDKGLAAIGQRFSEHPVDLDFSSGSAKPVRREPLPLWLSIEDDGSAIVDDAEDVQLCRQYRWAYRVK